jgi:glycosyltransferase involved in cell wall biosynthesis
LKIHENTFIVAQLGARMHYAVPRIFHLAGMLEHLATDICAVKGWPVFLKYWPTVLQPKGMRRLLGREPRGIPREKILANTALGLAYSVARLKTKSSEEAAGIDIHFGKRFCEYIVKEGFGKASGIYTYNAAGLELMQAADRMGIKTVMEQTIAPRAIELGIIEEAIQRYPDWSFNSLFGRNIEAFIDREETEWRYADLIICGSEFVKKGISARGGPVEKCVVVPYGVDDSFQVTRKPRSSEALKVLTVGQVGLRKGSPDVWEAARITRNKCVFRMVGGGVIPDKVLKHKPVNVELTGAIPRVDIAEHYSWADVFLLPSLCEGSATVTYEALASGMPVICTQNTGSLVEDGKNGFIISIFQPERIADILLNLCDNRHFLSELSLAAKEKSSVGTLASYQRRLIDAVNAC